VRWLTFPRKVYVEDLHKCSREDIQKLIVLEVESFQEERKTLFNPYELVHLSISHYHIRIEHFSSSVAPPSGYSATQPQSSESSNQTSWMNFSEDNNLHYERAMSPVGNDNVGLFIQ